MNLRRPILLFCWLFRAVLPAQTLLPGDIFVLGASANTAACGGIGGGDEITFVCFKDLQTGASLDLTDNGFQRCAPGFWGDFEGIVRLTRTGPSIPAGTALTLRLTSASGAGAYQFVSPDNAWAAQTLQMGFPSASALDLNVGGDQLFFMASGTWANGPATDDATYSGNVIFGFNTKTTWQADCASAGDANSDLPSDATLCANFAPAAPSDFLKYTGALAAATVLDWKNRLRNPANWSVFADCAAYSAAAPDFAAGLQLAILPTQIGIAGGTAGVCPGDTALLNLTLPSAGAPFTLAWTDGTQQFFTSGITAAVPFPLVPPSSAIYSFNGLSDASGCSVLGDLSVKFFIEVFRRDSTVLRDTTCIPSQAGIFTQKLTNRFGCDSLVTRDVFFDAANCALAFDLLATPVSCAGRMDGSLLFAAIKGTQPFVFQWVNLSTGATGSGQIAALFQPDTLPDLAGGQYRWTLTDANGVQGFFQIEVPEPPPLMGQIGVLSNYNGFDVRCANGDDGRAVAGAIGGIPGYTFAWSSGQTKATADDLTAGPHSVTITDFNGCQLTLSANLTAPPPLVADAEAFGETCFGKKNGRIVIHATSGGLPPYLYSFENQAFGAATEWVGLGEGAHLFTVQDAAGCEVNYAAVLPTGPTFRINGGADTVLFSGDTLFLQLQSTRPIGSVTYDPAASVWPITGGLAFFFPEKTTLYHFVAYDTAGCAAEDDLLVRVLRSRSIYVPNVFLPTAEKTENQRLTVFADPGVAEVLLFRVVDRWGELRFERAHFPPNSPPDGWDGQIGARQAPPGVYAWFARVRFTDGRVREYTGDAALMR